MAKGQMELLGLALVVVIVSVGMMYLLVFMVGKPPNLIHSKFAEKEISQNFISALLKTQSSGCKGLSLGELLQDCANFHNTGGSISCSAGTYSCSYAQQEIEHILMNSIYRWQFFYRFRVFINNDPDGQGNRILPKPCNAIPTPDPHSLPCLPGFHCALSIGAGSAGTETGNCIFSDIEVEVSLPDGSVETIIDETVNPFNPEGRCSDRINKETPGIQPVPLDVGTMTAMLEICRI